MDALTRLIQLTRPQAGLDLRCQFSGAYALPHEPAQAGIAPFHLVLGGSCSIAAADGSALQLHAGDFILFPRGGAHDIYSGNTDRRRPRHSTPRMVGGGMLPLRRIGKGEVDVDLLCGHFNYAAGPSELLFRSLPDPLWVSLLHGNADIADNANDADNDGAQRAAVALLQTLVELMRHEAAIQQAGALAIVTALSQALLVMALRNHAADKHGRSGILALLADARLGTSVQALLKEPGRAWTIEALGELSAMSRASYARHFSATAGISVWVFMTQIRMAIACDLLRDTRRNAGDIGMEVGYQSEAAFGKAFRQVVGVSPGQYRRRLQNGESVAI